MSKATSLDDILHVKVVSASFQETAALGVDDLLTPEQVVKATEIDSLLGEVGLPTVDEELDATILALTEIRDGAQSVSSSAVESQNSFKMSYNAFERSSMLLSQNYYQRMGGGYVRLKTEAMAAQKLPPTYGGQTIGAPEEPGAGMVLLRPGRFLWEMSVAKVNLPAADASFAVEVYDPTEYFLMADPARFSVEDDADPASWWPTTESGPQSLQYHGVATAMSGVVNVFNPGDAPSSVASLLSSVEVGDVLPIWFQAGGGPNSSADTSYFTSVIMQCTFTQLNSEPSRGEPTQAALEADAAMRSLGPSGLALAKAADAGVAPT